MAIHLANLNSAWASLLIEELVRNGCTYLCISPGSRSTPLAVAAARHPQVKTIICYDERGAAFHALGYARATGHPAVTICTSGTALANQLPAVVEAAMDCLPLLVISADRPSELHQTGANQTIPQYGMFAPYVRWQGELPCPDTEVPPQMPLTTLALALYHTRRIPKGPVHLNCLFREPLAPVDQGIPETYLAPLFRWLDGQEPYTHYEAPTLFFPGHRQQDLADTVHTTQRGLLVVGRLSTQEEKQAVAKLSRKLNWPVWADITSGLRLGSSPLQVIHFFDQLLLSAEFQNQYHPQTIFHLGGQLTSKRFLEWLESHPPESYIQVKEHPFRHDPAHRVTCRIEASLAYFCDWIYLMLQPAQDRQWLASQARLSQSVGTLVAQFLDQDDSLSEPAVAHLISRLISDAHGLFLASSMPIRDMDMYGSDTGSAVVVEANRGASGIDGTVATASGFAVGLDAPVTLLIGDLALIHDLSSLSLLASLPYPLILVVINNHGGSIFSFLPIAQFQDVFESHFGTPHSLGFQPISEMFGLDYAHPRTQEDFVLAYQSALASGRSTLIEVETNRDENVRLHRDLQQRIQETVERELQDQDNAADSG